MNVKSILSTIGKTALPALAAAVIPGSPLIGIAAKFISDKLGGPPIDSTPEAIDAAINQAHGQDPEILLKLQEADHAFQEYMTKLGFDSAAKIEELANADRADARAREVAVKDKTPQRLAYADGIIFLAAFVTVILVPVPAAVHDLLLIMITTLANNVVGERSYYFGSSSGSAAKTEILADQAKAGK